MLCLLLLWLAINVINKFFYDLTQKYDNLLQRNGIPVMFDLYQERLEKIVLGSKGLKKV